MHSKLMPASCLLPFVIVLAACQSDRSSAAAQEHSPPIIAEPTTPKPAPPPAPTPPAVASAPALILTPPAGWVVEVPTSKMRKAQYVLPHADGDSEDASLIVYYFGGQGGGTHEANLDRWAGQFEQPDGSSSAEAITSSERTIAGMSVFDATVSGTYVAETAPGSGERVNKPGWRMIASIVDTKEGPWYFKLVGPAATLAKWEPSYDTFLKAIRPGN